MTTSTTNRGKPTEKKVEAFLKAANNRLDTAFLRFPDARAARGMLAAQVADFLVVCQGRSIFLEAKHTNHAFRLSKDKVPQLALLKKFSEAFAHALVLVEHEGLGWRVVNVMAMSSDVPSWDLRDHKVFPNVEAALLSTGYFWE